MYEQFTDRARQIMQLANQEAQRFNHDFIGTEHLLLALIAEGSGVAANVLQNLDIDLWKVRREVEKIIQAGPDAIRMGRLPQTPRAKKVLEYAIEESKQLGQNYIGTEHLLLGLLRETEGVACQVLMIFGIDLDRTREAVRFIIGRNGDRPAAPQPERSTSTQDVVHKNLPPYARSINAEFDWLIAMIETAKEKLVADQDYDRAAALRDLADPLKKQRNDFIKRWPQDSFKEP